MPDYYCFSYMRNLLLKEKIYFSLLQKVEEPAATVAIKVPLRSQLQSRSLRPALPSLRTTPHHTFPKHNAEFQGL